MILSIEECRAGRIVGDMGLDYELPLAMIYDEIIKNKKVDKEATKKKAELVTKDSVDKEKGKEVPATPNCGKNIKSSKKSKGVVLDHLQGWLPRDLKSKSRRSRPMRMTILKYLVV
ncbi:hypothetical protein AMTR_s00023p00205890 [Amborella trichopoda]|uniref:Uncharacterized protein n=1 Tax=Amborella trichopoda TaxID=13333 RepID=W1NIV4_AMBTC|nr:hypothetical protein AMTR_s00023p00205890 [Amborella trichopoda]